MPVEICTHPWRYQADPFRIAGPLYYVGNKDVSSHLIDTGAGLILIDSTYPQTAYLLLESIRRLGFNPDEIHTILHCHPHYDHCGATRALVELTGAKTAIGALDAEMLGSRRDLSWAPEYGTEFYETFTPDQLLKDGDKIRLGDITIKCVHTPGHTAGCLSFFFDVNNGACTCTAGLFGGPGLNTLSTDYLDNNRLPYSNRDDYLKSVRRLKNYHVDLFLGAHPEQNDTFSKQARLGAEGNPFIDPQGWLVFLNHLENKAILEFQE